jgi:hypothetical protein
MSGHLWHNYVRGTGQRPLPYLIQRGIIRPTYDTTPRNISYHSQYVHKTVFLGTIGLSTLQQIACTLRMESNRSSTMMANIRIL